MSKVKDYIIEKRVSLAKYTDIKYDFMLNKIYYNCVSKLMARLNNDLDEFVKDLFKSEYGMDVLRFTHSIDKVDESKYINYLLFAKSLNYSITITEFNDEDLKNFLEEDIVFKDVYDLVVYRDVAELYSSTDEDLYKTYTPGVLYNIHESILDFYNSRIQNIRDMTKEQVICNVCGAPSIDYVLVDQYSRVYDSRKCRLDE